MRTSETTTGVVGYCRVMTHGQAPCRTRHIDLGLERNPATDHVTARTLDRSADLGADHFPDDVVELILSLLPNEQPAHPASVSGCGYLPEVRLSGSSTFGAQLAGILGSSYSLAYHFDPALLHHSVKSSRSTSNPLCCSASPTLWSRYR